MRAYGIKYFHNFDVFRYKIPLNQHLVSVPLSIPNNQNFRTRPDLLYLTEDSGTITITECNTNPSLVGTTLTGGNVYSLEQLCGNNVVTIESDNTETCCVIVNARRENFQLGSGELVTINTEYTLPPNSYAVVVEGSINVSNTIVNSNDDIYIIHCPANGEKIVSGNGKLLKFNLADA